MNPRLARRRATPCTMQPASSRRLTIAPNSRPQVPRCDGSNKLWLFSEPMIVRTDFFCSRETFEARAAMGWPEPDGYVSRQFHCRACLALRSRRRRLAVWGGRKGRTGTDAGIISARPPQKVRQRRRCNCERSLSLSRAGGVVQLHHERVQDCPWDVLWVIASLDRGSNTMVLVPEEY